ncbi:uncharacterized protein STEHIDRAFT_107183 [Stereum hirsutum FP-91666 SS1]|uniref:uncharacterized protein n=1 Tax=Stereum hirsutum (strain FP-91666) TaxID=721885 RepID=UPI000440C115|nr:uncharacterized protein STEHIDRAFT_107183 [Stereum hirsutum FP-91666 SS1]EIM92777.1 hypothetical protein STEHIDRAFT_107183 [Stereum hirsutum FP-91666 SS1]
MSQPVNVRPNVSADWKITGELTGSRACRSYARTKPTRVRQACVLVLDIEWMSFRPEKRAEAITYGGDGQHRTTVVGSVNDKRYSERFGIKIEKNNGSKKECEESQRERAREEV